MKILAVMIGVSLSVATTHSQTPLPAFEVASVRANQTGSPNSSTRLTGSTFTATNVSLVSMLRAAYAIQEFQIDAKQSWADIDRFDIVAKLPAGAAPAEWPRMMQSLLRDRFKLAFHLEPRPTSVYVLTAMKDGHKLRPADPSRCSNPSGSCGFNGSPSKIDGQSVTTEQLAARLSRSIGVMVIDKTGLRGLYDIDLEWTVEDQFRGRGASANPTIFPAIQEQLGLRLDSARAPVDVLVVDRAEKPTPD